ncbi:MAG: EAL domain-containing protein [Bacillota bacterium]|nr:EAL domain-containing protein [Bacillota bacterium]
MAEIISILFYIIFVVSILIAAYILFSNPSRWDVRLAFLIALATAVRNLGYSMRSVATSFDEAILWTYIAAIGWTSFYCLTFAWFYNYLFRRFNKFFTALAFFAYIGLLWTFVLSPSSSEFYNLVITKFGIVDVKYFYGSTASYSEMVSAVIYVSVISLIIVSSIVQLVNSKDTKKKGNLTILVSGFSLAVLLSLVSDQLGQLMTENQLPSLSPIYSVLVIGSILTVLIRDEKVRPLSVLMTTYRNIEDIESRVWERVEIYIVIIALASFGLNRIFFSNSYNNDEYILLITALTVASLMRIMRLTLKNKTLTGFVLVFLLSVEIIVSMTVGFRTSLISVWFYPFCYLPLLVLLTDRKAIFAVCALSVFYALSVMFNMGGKWSGFNTQGVIQRVTLSLIFCLQLFYGNRFYRKRNSYNQRLIEIQEKYAEVTAYYIDINIENYVAKTEGMLKLCREFINADRFFVLMFDYKKDCVIEHYESLGENVSSTRNIMKNIRLSDMKWFFERLRTDGILSVQDIRTLPREAKSEILLFSWSAIESIYCAPIYSGTEIVGVVGQEKVKSDLTLPKEEEDFVIFAANAQAEAFSKIVSQNKINQMAYYNALTNLPNRFEFQKRVEHVINVEKNEDCAMVFLDLDSFQEINDVIGHDGGDELLVLLAKEISRKIGKNDILAHYAGDEFAILLTNVSSRHEVGQKVSDILNSVRIPKKILNREFFVSASAGVSMYKEDAHSFDQMISNSELAQYVAKKTGKNKYIICDEYMKIENLHRIEMKKSFVAAIDRGELFIEYQPVLESAEMKSIGFEALLRWRHRDYNILYPEEFLPLSDEVVLNSKILNFVVEESCKQLKKWEAEGYETRITVNMSCDQIDHIDFAKIFEDNILLYGINPSGLVAEISEKYGYEIDNDMLGRLRSLGMSVSIDEFGSKNSSLARIAHLNIDEIKIDMGFVQRIGSTRKDDGIAQSIIEMGSDLGLKVTALGIENNEQYEFFKASGCHYVQGYFFYRSMRAEDATDLLAFHRGEHQGIKEKETLPHLKAAPGYQ